MTCFVKFFYERMPLAKSDLKLFIVFHCDGRAFEVFLLIIEAVGVVPSSCLRCWSLGIGLGSIFSSDKCPFAVKGQVGLSRTRVCVYLSFV